MAQAAVQPRSNDNVQLRARPSLTIKRNLKAPPAKIFAAWTDPAKLQKWFYLMPTRRFHMLTSMCAKAAAIRSRSGAAMASINM